jgi:hypothetical protein
MTEPDDLHQRAGALQGHEEGHPNDVLELVNKTDKVLTIAWEPHGDRFTDRTGVSLASRFSISFYAKWRQVAEGGRKLLGTVRNRCATTVRGLPGYLTLTDPALENHLVCCRPSFPAKSKCDQRAPWAWDHRFCCGNTTGIASLAYAGLPDPSADDCPRATRLP